MRSAGRFALAVALTALMLLVGPYLVQDHSEAEAQEAEEPVRNAVLLVVGDLPVQPAQAVVPEQTAERMEAVTAWVRQELPQIRVVCDGNGWILRSRSWAREAYAACPPEKRPGG